MLFLQGMLGHYGPGWSSWQGGGLEYLLDLCVGASGDASTDIDRLIRALHWPSQGRPAGLSLTERLATSWTSTVGFSQ